MPSGHMHTAMPGGAGVPSSLMLPLSTAFLCLQTRECCAGFFGPQCQPCPGKAGSACFGNGVCMDGINGTGTCQCGAGFVGTACESCAEGKYGRNCDQGTERPRTMLVRRVQKG